MENTRKTTVTVCHGLKLVPLGHITRFARVGARVLIKLNAFPVEAAAIPGSVLVTSTTADGVVKKKIEYGQIDDGYEALDALDRLERTRLVATYLDQRGNRRVCGSPDYPLSLSYQCQDGVIRVTIEGADTQADAYTG